jgi:hypothetical protein
MSSLYKFENKLIDYSTNEELRGYLSNAKKELLKIHRACEFDDNVKIVEDRTLIKVSLVSDNFCLSVRHGEIVHKTTIKLFKNGGFVRNLSLVNLYNPNLIKELKSFM